MPLASGIRLGPYEIHSVLGAGGMGEVYRARDTRLRREVALKVLPESFAGDTERLLRFQQEARAVAALSHPNILSVHDIGMHDGIHYIVTELLDGETLRDKLRPGPLPARRAVDYAIQIARGLASAHEKGIVHRDLKPENVFITKDGRVKILDFGLAKQNAASIPASDAATLADVHTTAGVVLGTVGYMSPEQVRGEAADGRSDIFAFGTVLYEMLTAHRAFRGSSSVETMNAILKEEPEEIVRSGEVWPSLQKLLQHCLEKNPAHRFQSAQDLTFALEAIVDSTAQTRPVHSSPSRSSRVVIAASAVAVLLLAAAALAIRPLWVHSQQPEFLQLTYRLGYVQAARFAADGQNIVYGASWDRPGMKLYSSALDAIDGRPLDMPPAELLSVSRSGELAVALNGRTWNGVGSRLARAPLAGGAPRELLDNVTNADWSPSGQLAVARFENGKCRLEYPIGNPLYQMIGWISHMRFSPQGDAIAFIEHPIAADDRGTVSVVALNGQKRALTREWAGAEGLAWSPAGDEIWFTATAGADVDRPIRAVTRSGKERLVLRAPGGLYLEDIAPDGRVLLRRDERRFQVVGGPIAGEARNLSWLEIMIARSVSRDGKFAVMSDESGKEYGAYLRNLDGSPAVLLGPGDAGGISPDGGWVTSILPDDTSKILLLPTSVGETRSATAPGFHYRTAGWASGGHRLIVRASESDRPLRFWVQEIDGGSPKPITPEGVDGLFVTVNHSDYVSTRDASGTIRLYPTDGGEPKVVAHLNPSEEVIGGASNSDFLYLTSDAYEIPLQVSKLSITTGLRQPFVSFMPRDLSGVVFIVPPIFSPSEKEYIYTLIRAFSVLYVVKGLK